MLSPYIFGLALAYILAPVVESVEAGISWLGERKRLGFLKRVSRVLAVVIVYLLLIAILVSFFSVFVPMLIQQGKASLGSAGHDLAIHLAAW